MLSLPDAIVQLLAPFAMLFTNPTWQKAQLLLVGTILTTGQPTVAAALWVMGRSDHDDYACYQEALNRAVWSSRRGRASCSCFCFSTLMVATAPWSSASTKPWNGVAAPGSCPEVFIETRCVPVAVNWSRPVGCAGSP